ncbi:MAG: hypothetical protein LBF89_10520 [Bacteroidales bacterium]|jgi:hypothetical protein|nr:hypothetical protein [Bacteroidales bacterium]
MKDKKSHIRESRAVGIPVKYLYFLPAILLFLSSCGPVHRFTRLKRTPREYSLNYCYSDIKARKSGFNKESWIVFSDRDRNDTWQNPGGKVKWKMMSFMEAFFVIREKGDYLQLVKYDPEIVEDNPRARIIKKRDKVQYYGWVHRSRLLLTKQSSLDIATGFKNKAVVIVSDTSALVEPHLFFESDSVLAYRDEDLKLPNGKIPVHELLYILKSSGDNRKALVARKTSLDPLKAESETAGWIPTSVIRETGQRLFVDIESIKKDTLSSAPLFLDREKENMLDIMEAEERRIAVFKNYPAFRYSPVRSYHADSGQICFNTMLPAPIIDRRLNYVLNLNGNKIMFEDFLRLEEDLKKLNLVFVFEGKERVFGEYSRIMNVVQNLQGLFEQEGDRYQYKFGAVIAYQDTVRRVTPLIKSYGLTASCAGVLDFLMSEKDSVARYRSIANSQAWTGLRRAVDMIEPYKNETNILVVIGESGYSEQADSVLVRRIANANGRILGYQIYNETLSDADNNFVLQIEHMIDTYVRYDAVSRRERLVYTDQFKPDYGYRESARNAYALDYPQNSMTQGWVLFPGKNENMQMDILSKSIDTLFTEVKHDNDSIISCLYRAFVEMGSNRYVYDNLWTGYNGKDSLWYLNQEFPRRMSNHLPAWYMPSATVFIDSTDNNLDYHLLLSEDELAEITAFLEDVTKYEPDYKYSGRRNNKKRQPCDCPDDYLSQDNTPPVEPEYDDEGHPKYLSTRGIRRHVYKTFMNRLKSSYKLCPAKSGQMKGYSLAKALFEIAGCPVREEMVNMYRIKDLKRKSMIKDFELDALLLYFKHKKEELEADRKMTFLSGGEPFYWIKRDLLP